MTNDFWFEQWSTRNEDPFSVSLVPGDGFHFRGFWEHHSGSFHTRTLGVLLKYSLSQDRIPASPSGRWRSAPHVDLFGTVFGETLGSDLPPIQLGDHWSKCFLHLRHKLFHPSLPNPLGEASARVPLFDLQEYELSDRHSFNGFFPLPELEIRGILPGEPLNAELEVLFEAQLEGDATLGFSFGNAPADLRLVDSQWPLQAIDAPPPPPPRCAAIRREIDEKDAEIVKLTTERQGLDPRIDRAEIRRINAEIEKLRVKIKALKGESQSLGC